MAFSRVWKISPGEGAKYWPAFRDRCLIAVGFERSLDVSQYGSRGELKAAIGQIGREKAPGYSAKQMWTLAREMRVGDTVVAYGNKQVLGIGEITGEYEYHADSEGFYPHRRAVRWDDLTALPTTDFSPRLRQYLARNVTILELTPGQLAEIRGGSTQHMLFRIAWRPNGWFGGVCSDPLGNKICEKFGYIRDSKKAKGPCTAERFYCVDEHAAFSEWWVRMHEGNQPQQLQTGASLVFLLSHNPRRGENLHYVGFYKLKAVTEDEKGKRCIMKADPSRSAAFDPDLLELRGDEYPLEKWRSGSFRYIGNNAAVRILNRALDAHQNKVKEVPLDEKKQWQEVVGKIRRVSEELGGDNKPITYLQRYFVGQGFQFTSHQLATFYTALKTKGFVILSGLSGTGKTKLAQLFAELMPSPEVETLEEPEISEVDIRIQVQPYMLKYARMIIPKGYWKLIDVPPAGETIEVEVSFDGRKQNCRFGHAAYSGTDYLGLYFRGQVKEWFVSSFQEGDTVAVEPIIDEEEGTFIGFRLSRPKARRVRKRERNSWFVPVRPDWRDSKSLLGYYNPLSGQFESTEFLRFLLRACDNYRSSLHELDWEADHPDATTLLAEPKAFASDGVRLGVIASDTSGRIMAQGAFEFHVNEGRQLSLPGQMSKLEPFRDAAKIYALELDRVYPHFVILDEMNLARVEYYFADFLSVLESGRSADGWTKEAIALHDFRSPVEDADGNPIPAQIKLPPNLYFAGTVNVDETTYMFSPKVLDRAFTLEFTEVDFADYPSEMGEELLEGELERLRQQLLKDFTQDGKFAIVDKGTIAGFAAQHPKYPKHLESLKVRLEPYDLHFAYRVFDEITAFLANAEDSPVSAGFTGLDDAFDTAVLMKVLPKFHGPRGKLERPLLSTLAWALNPDAPEAKAEDLERRVKDEKKRLDLIEELRAPSGMRIAEAGEPTHGAPMRAADFAYPRTALKVLRMLHALYTTGFASFA